MEYQKPPETLSTHKLGIFLEAEKIKLQVLQKGTEDKAIRTHLTQQSQKLEKFEKQVQLLPPTEREDLANVWEVFKKHTNSFNEMLWLLKDTQTIMKHYPKADFANLRTLKTPSSSKKVPVDEAIERIAKIIDAERMSLQFTVSKGKSPTENFPLIRSMTKCKYFSILL